MCQIVTEAGADYIKTSTGFGGAGATFADIELFSRHIGPKCKDESSRRNFFPGGCREVPCTWCRPTGNQPDYKDCKE